MDEARDRGMPGSNDQKEEWMIGSFCPPADMDRMARTHEVLRRAGKWLYSGALTDLVRMFGGEPERSGDLCADAERIRAFAEEKWNYRRGRERWTVGNEMFDEDRERILRACRELGLIGKTEPVAEPDYILPLGGFRATNRERPLMARETIDRYGWTGKTVAALSGMRPLDLEREGEALAAFAPDAETEYGAISAGLEKAFGVRACEEQVFSSDCVNSCAAIRRYSEAYRGNAIWSLAAPSLEPEIRRANSFDTFAYFLEKFSVRRGSRLLMITNCVYVPYQVMKFMGLALEGGFEVDGIGADYVLTPPDPNGLNATAYLQEVKGVIDAVAAFIARNGSAA